MLVSWKKKMEIFPLYDKWSCIELKIKSEKSKKIKTKHGKHLNNKAGICVRHCLPIECQHEGDMSPLCRSSFASPMFPASHWKVIGKTLPIYKVNKWERLNHLPYIIQIRSGWPNLELSILSMFYLIQFIHPFSIKVEYQYCFWNSLSKIMPCW